MVRLLLLGPVDLRDGERSLPLGAPRHRALLARLALAEGRVVSVADLVDDLWGQESPPSAVNAIQVYVAALRKTLTNAGLGGALLTAAPGYRLHLPPGCLDTDEASAALAAARRRHGRGDWPGAAESFASALALWRGAALADLVDVPFADHERDRWREIRSAAEEGWLQALVRSGRFGEAIPSLELAVRAEPYREGLWELLVTALYQAGRQNDALSTVRRVRRLLRDDLGVDLGPALVDLERRVLAHELAPVAAGRAPLHLAPDLATHVAGATWTTKDNDDARLVLPDGTERKIGETPVTIGRHERCEVVLGHRDVSRRHAILALIDGTRLLSDLGSTNGTLLNGHPVGADPQPVVHGDRIEVGPIVLRYETGPGARREATWSTVASAPKTR